MMTRPLNYSGLESELGSDFVGTVYHPPKPQYRPELLLVYIEVIIDEINQNFLGCNITLAGNFNQLSDREISERTGLISTVHQPTLGANILDRIYVSHSRVLLISSDLKRSSTVVIVVVSCQPTSKRLLTFCVRTPMKNCLTP